MVFFKNKGMFKRAAIYLLVIGISLLFSCKAWISKKYHFNQEFPFKTPEGYLSYLEKKKGFDLSHVIYPDTSTLENFLFYISKNQLAEYYGSLINDSTEIKKTESLQDNLSCMGRVINEINTNSKQGSITDTNLAKNDFYKYNFRFISSKNKFDLNNSPKPLKIILLYTYSYGTYFDSFLKEMNKFSKEHEKDAEVYIISLDYPFHFK